LSETVIYDLALESHDAAIALLPVAWCLASKRVLAVPEPTPFQRKLLARGGIYQIGLSSVVLPKVDEFIQLDRSLSVGHGRADDTHGAATFTRCVGTLLHAAGKRRIRTGGQC
jgi:hypothetical protein